jgi:Putative beta barrel porin-7 (BBP7)
MRLNKHICVGILSLVPITAGPLATPAAAQLRTGREQRTLYHDQLVTEQKSKPQEFKAATKRDSKVTPAAYEEIKSAKSILDSQAAEPIAEKAVGSGRATKTTSRPAAQDQAVQGPVTHNPIIDDGYLPSELAVSGGCNCGRCGGGLVSGCSSGCDDFAELAPTCAGTCGPTGCGDAMFSGCSPLGSLLSRLTIRAEVPLYWRRAAGPPPLVTTAQAGTPQAAAGELGEPNTQILLGNASLSDTANAGFRITLGTWLRHDRYYGLLFRYWNAGEQNDTFNFTSSQNEILARPFLNTTTGTSAQDTQLIAFPNQSTGNISVSTGSEVYGLNIMLRRLAYQDRFTRVDWLYGYQHVSIDETLSINSNTLVTGNQNPALTGASIAVTDRFATQNDFNGLTYGFMGNRDLGCFKLESMFRLGLGNLRRQANANGSTTTTSAAGVSATESQGLLARNTNIQPFKDDTFTVLPEVGFNVAYRIRPGLDFNVGYNYMLVPKVLQAGQQIDKDLAVNLSDPLTGSLDPQLDIEQRKYWLHSLGLGLQWNY